jgi:hypothetical protein
MIVLAFASNAEWTWSKSNVLIMQKDIQITQGLETSVLLRLKLDFGKFFWFFE